MSTDRQPASSTNPPKQQYSRPRPDIGTVTTREVRVPVCRSCGFIRTDGLCSDDCDLDGMPAEVFYAVYSCVETLIREESEDGTVLRAARGEPAKEGRS